MKNIVIILAAGNASRCGGDKLFTSKFGKPVILQTLEKFQNCWDIDEIVLVFPCAERWNKETSDKFTSRYKKIIKSLPGADTRFGSLKIALDYLSSEKENARILVHNGANPYIKTSEISAGIKLSQEKKNVIFGYFSQNSIKKVIDGKVIEFLNRDEIFETQTPQISDLQTLLRGMKSEKLKVKKDGIFIRDEAELLELIGEEVFIYECSPRNHKITTEEDFSDTFRIGVGEDLHRFANVKGKRLNIKIGGVEFPDFDKVFEANSDGDPVLHALCNALLSAIGEKPFSSFADEMCRTGITNSTKYVERTLEIVRAKYPDFQIQNVAISLELLEPKIAPKHNEILENMAQILNIAPSQIGLMYTTGEGLKYGVGAKVEVLLRIL